MFNKGPMTREALEKALIDCVKFLGHSKYDDCVKELYEAYLEDYLRKQPNLDSNSVEGVDETQESPKFDESDDEAEVGF
jgi:hypothetical protein